MMVHGGYWMLLAWCVVLCMLLSLGNGLLIIRYMSRSRVWLIIWRNWKWWSHIMKWSFRITISLLRNKRKLMMAKWRRGGSRPERQRRARQNGPTRPQMRPKLQPRLKKRFNKPPFSEWMSFRKLNFQNKPTKIMKL